jgi:hypothetical protein
LALNIKLFRCAGVGFAIIFKAYWNLYLQTWHVFQYLLFYYQCYHVKVYLVHLVETVVLKIMTMDPMMSKKCHYQNAGSILNLNCHLDWWQLQLFFVDELALSQWRGEFLSMKLCPFISVLCFFRAIYHSSHDFLHPHYIAYTKYNTDFYRNDMVKLKDV